MYGATMILAFFECCNIYGAIVMVWSDVMYGVERCNIYDGIVMVSNDVTLSCYCPSDS